MFKERWRIAPSFWPGITLACGRLLHPAKHQLKLGYSLAHGTLASGQRSKWHVLASSEVYYFIAGRGRFTIDDQVTLIEAGTIIYVPPGGQAVVGKYRERPMSSFCVWSIRPGGWKMKRYLE